jgi:hypothetical protein
MNKMGKEEILVNIFEQVQKVLYKVCRYDKNLIDENLSYGDCRHKSELLFQLLKKNKFEAKKIKVLFDWRDLPIPEETLSILKKSDKIWLHDSVKVKVNNKWLKVDCTWNPELEKFGFPVTRNWNGKEDTKQVTTGELKFYNKNLIKKPKIIKKEAYKFAEKINYFLDHEQ